MNLYFTIFLIAFHTQNPIIPTTTTHLCRHFLTWQTFQCELRSLFSGCVNVVVGVAHTYTHTCLLLRCHLYSKLNKMLNN